MKIYSYSILIFSICHFFLSCSKSSESGNIQLTPKIAFETTYEAPSFEEDNRKKQLLTIEPAFHQMMEAHMDERKIPGIAYGAILDQELVFASARGVIDKKKEQKATTQSVFRIASMTKSFTAMAILKLRDEGKLSLHDPARTYIKAMDKLAYLTLDAPEITIFNLLTMTAGFPEDNPWGDRQLDESDEMLLDLMRNGPSFSNVPAYTYEYSNTGYALLGNIISVVSGVPYQDYIRNQIFTPLGMNSTYWEIDQVPADKLVIGYRWEDDTWKLEPMLHDGSYGAMGGLLTTIEDFSKYVSFLLSAWPPRNEADDGPIKRSSLREMQTPYFPRLNAQSTNFDGTPCPTMVGYGYGLSILTDCAGRKTVSHGGALPGFGSHYVLFPDFGMAFMAFGNLTYTRPWPSREIIHELVFKALNPQKRILPPSKILLKRQQQIVDFIQDWETANEDSLLAENFYLDWTKAHRQAEAREIFQKAGPILFIGPLTPFNQLRGRFEIQVQNGTIRVFFTLSPEKEPRVQRLNLSFIPKSK